MVGPEYFGIDLVRQAESADLSTLAAIEPECQSDPWPHERIEAFVTTPHEGHEQFAIIALLMAKPWVTR